MVAQKVALCD